MLFMYFDKLSFWVTYHEMYATCVERRPELFREFSIFLDNFLAGCARLTGARHMRHNHSHALRVIDGFLSKQKHISMRPTLYA